MLQTNRKMLGYMIKKSGCAALLRVLRIRLVYLLLTELVSELSLDELTVEASDVGDAFVLRADSFASTSVGAVTETEFVHLGNHCLGTLGSFGTTLRKECELTHLGADEQHGGTVLAGSHASAAADAGGAIHGFVGILLGNEDGVGILRSTGANGDITAGSLDFVKCGTIDHAVFDDGESSGAPGFHGDDVAIVEAAHVELTGGGTGFCLAVGRAVDVEGAHTADSFTAVVVKDEGFFALFNQFLVEDVEHLEEGSVVGNVVHFA